MTIVKEEINLCVIASMKSDTLAHLTLVRRLTCC